MFVWGRFSLDSYENKYVFKTFQYTSLYVYNIFSVHARNEAFVQSQFWPKGGLGFFTSYFRLKITA